MCCRVVRACALVNWMALCLLKAAKNIRFSLSIVLTVYVVYSWRDSEKMQVTGNLEVRASQSPTFERYKENPIHLVVVACEGKTKRVLHDAVTMVKSALIFSKANLVVHIFTNTLRADFELEFSKWPKKVLEGIVIRFYGVKYPLPPEDELELKDWWGPCASFRLFLPQVLEQVDSVIYVDSDVIFLGPIDDLWDHFIHFDRKHVGALAPRVGWDFKVPDYNPNFIKKPDGKLTQVNSGVCPLNGVS